MAWVDWDDLTFLSQRTDADTYSAADMNSVNENIRQIRDNLIIALGSYDAPVRSLSTLYEDVIDLDERMDQAETDIENLQATVGYVPKFINGLTMSNAEDTEHDITIAVGATNDSTNAYILKLTSNITKQIDASWSKGNNAGGLFSGTVEANTWYHVFLIRKDSDGTVDAGFDTSLTASNKPSGYTYYRYIGSIKTDASSNIHNFIQYNNIFWWKKEKLDWNAKSVGTSKVTTSVSVPYGIRSLVYFNLYTNEVGTPSFSVFCPDVTTSGYGYTDLNSYIGATPQLSNLNSQLSAIANTTINITLITKGYCNLLL